MLPDEIQLDRSNWICILVVERTENKKIKIVLTT
jgi:hypothetical protein